MQSLFDTSLNSTIQEGFVVNMKCQQFEGIFHEQRITYKDNSLWLFIDNRIEASNVNETIVSEVIKYIRGMISKNMVKLQLFQVQYKSKFSALNAFPLSDLFIAKQTQLDPIQWAIFDAYKVDYGYEMEVSQNGIIEASENNALTFNGANFFAKRRKNLKGIHIPCGLVVIIIFFLFSISTIYQL